MRFTATVFRDAVPQLSVEGGGRFFTHVFPDGFVFKEMFKEDAGGGISVLKVRGEVRQMTNYNVQSTNADKKQVTKGNQPLKNSPLRERGARESFPDGVGCLNENENEAAGDLTDVQNEAAGNMRRQLKENEAAADFTNKQYLAAFPISAYGINTALSVLCDEIEDNGGEVQTLTRLNDIAGRAAVQKYGYDEKTKSFETIDNYAVYLHSEARRPRNDRLLPFALFEAVRAGDFVAARALMTGSLNSVIETDAALKAFFADYTSITPDYFYGGSGVILKSLKRGAILNCAVKGGKLDDISLVEN